MVYGLFDCIGARPVQLLDLIAAQLLASDAVGCCSIIRLITRHLTMAWSSSVPKVKIRDRARLGTHIQVHIGIN